MTYAPTLDARTAPAHRLVQARLGAEASAAIATVDLDAAFAVPAGPGEVSAAAFAAALCAVLHHELLARVPTGAAFVADQIAGGARIHFDHGALRTIRFGEGPTGALPAGVAAFERILAPLGYAEAGLYPLPRLRMTGHAYAHRDLPRGLPQFFVGELHVDAFDAEVERAARAVFGASVDPLTPAAVALLDRFAATGAAPEALALEGFPEIVAAFGRQHPDPAWSDYQALKAHSAEAAWIATEGNAFNHGTSLVDDVEAVAERERARGRPIKERVEVSASGRVRQTAFIADPVERSFRDGAAHATRTVPGSFYEIISRAIDPETGLPDPRFDSANATGIFAVTNAA